MITWNARKWLSEYWTPIVKRTVSEDEHNKTDLAFATAVYAAGFEAGQSSVWAYINNDIIEKNKRPVPEDE